MPKKDSLTYEINEVHWISDDEKKAYLNISWGNGEPKDELRRIWKDDNGDIHPGKGIAISAEELEQILESIRRAKKKRGKNPVNFDAVFASAGGILDKREKGYSTMDGFIKLHRRGKNLI